MSARRSIKLISLTAAGLLVVAGCSSSDNKSQSSVTPAEAREIAKEAYVYGFPMVDSYRIQHAYFVDKQNPEYRGDWNVIHNTARVYTPADTAVQTPNSDTPYSMVGADLRTEPLVLTLPAIEKNRYYSVQFIDGYTYNFAYAGSRTTGNGGGKFLLAGPGFKGEKPAGIDEVIRSETELVLAVYRTQLFGPEDLGNVEKIQAGYQVEPLSAFLHEAPPKAAPTIDFVQPLSAADEKTSLKFFNIMNFVLRYAPTMPSEKATRDKFATIGIGPDGTFNADKLSPEMKAAIQGGMSDAWAELTTFEKDKINTGQVTSGDLFGTPKELGDNYLYRMAGAVFGIYGNSKQEAMYPTLSDDSSGAPLTGANNYTLHFPPGQLPPVNAFWSVTMYELPSSLLVANPINRYLINSPMLDSLIKDPDGGITLYVQNQSPGADKEANWLPAPTGSMRVVMRLYWPQDQALNGQWKTPQLVKA